MYSTNLVLFVLNGLSRSKDSFQTISTSFVINILKSGDPHLESELLFSEPNETVVKNVKGRKICFFIMHCDTSILKEGLCS